MNIKNLRKGMIIKNYKELCKILEIEEKRGNSQKAQYKEMARFFKFTKVGYKFKVLQVYSEPLPPEGYERGKNPNSRGNNTKFRNYIVDGIVDMLAMSCDKIDMSKENPYIICSYKDIMENIGMVNRYFNTANENKEVLAKILNVSLESVEYSMEKVTENNYNRVYTAVKSLEQRCWILANTSYKATTIDNKYVIVNPQEEKILLMAEKKTMEVYNITNYYEIYAKPEMCYKFYQSYNEEVLRLTTAYNKENPDVRILKKAYRVFKLTALDEFKEILKDKRKTILENAKQLEEESDLAKNIISSFKKSTIKYIDIVEKEEGYVYGNEFLTESINVAESVTYKENAIDRYMVENELGFYDVFPKKVEIEKTRKPHTNVQDAIKQEILFCQDDNKRKDLENKFKITRDEIVKEMNNKKII